MSFAASDAPPRYGSRHQPRLRFAPHGPADVLEDRRVREAGGARRRPRSAITSRSARELGDEDDERRDVLRGDRAEEATRQIPAELAVRPGRGPRGARGARRRAPSTARDRSRSAGARDRARALSLRSGCARARPRRTARSAPVALVAARPPRETHTTPSGRPDPTAERDASSASATPTKCAGLRANREVRHEHRVEHGHDHLVGHLGLALAERNGTRRRERLHRRRREERLGPRERRRLGQDALEQRAPQHGDRVRARLDLAMEMEHDGGDELGRQLVERGVARAEGGHDATRTGVSTSWVGIDR